MTTAIHPTVDRSVNKGAAGFGGGSLQCQCGTDKVEVEIATQVAFNHACGCTKCWKPKGTTFSVVGVVPRDKLSVFHPELSPQQGWEGPGFAAFVSSVMESGTPPSKMADIRQTLREKGLEPYDCLSPLLMDVIATHAAKAKGVYKEA